jgi:hypothetical protein
MATMTILRARRRAPQLRERRPRPVALIGALLLAALALRALVDVDPSRTYLWLGSSAATFLTGTVAWALFVRRSLRGSSRQMGQRPVEPQSHAVATERHAFRPSEGVGEVSAGHLNCVCDLAERGRLAEARVQELLCPIHNTQR